MKERIKKSWFYPPALWGSVYRLQIKKRFFWKTVSWNYCSVLDKRKDLFGIAEWLKWDAGRR